MPENPNLDYYYILRETGETEPILIEYGFIDNKNDSIKLKKNIIDYAEAVIKAITQYIDYPYTPPYEEPKESYIVKKGDTLYSISKTFNIPISEIKRINNLVSDNLQIGQVLYFTDEINPKKKYIVKKGDTLYSISKEFNIPIDNIIKMNNLESDNLVIGQKLNLYSNDTNEINNDYLTYIVEKNDSIWKISQKYNISPEELIKINNLTDLTLKIGQEILVPNIEQEKTSFSTYTVQNGDTLFMGNNEY